MSTFRNGSTVDSRDAVNVVGRRATDPGHDRLGTARLAGGERQPQPIHSTSYHGRIPASCFTWAA